MKKLSTLLLGLIIASQPVWAGLPPTTSKGSADSSNKVTFNYLFPGHSVSHSGPTATILPATPIAPNFIGQTTSWAPTNPDDRNLEGSVGNWLAFANTVAGSLPDNGMTGGSPTVTCTRSTTNPLDGAASLLVTKGASNRQGDGCSVVFNVQPAYQGSTATITAALNISSGSIVQGDVKLFIYDVTNSLLITPYNNDVIAGPTLTATFPLSARAATPANQQYRLGIYFASTSATAVTLQLDDFAVSPGQAAYGVAGSNWTAYTPSFSAGWGTVSSATGFYRRDKDGIEVTGSATLGTVAASLGSISLPTSLALDTTKLNHSSNTTGNAGDNVGWIQQQAAGAARTFALITAPGTSTGFVYAAGNVATSNNLIAVNPGTTFDTGGLVSFYFKVPIAGFDANVTMASSSTFKISSYLANGTRVTGSAPNALGQYRSYLRDAGATTISETNGTPTATPSVADGVKIYTASTFAAADASNSPSAYEIFVGKNKNVSYVFYSSTGRTGTAVVDAHTTGTTDVGLQRSYDPTTGIVTINQYAAGSTNLRIGKTALNSSSLTSLYFDITVSENALAVGVQAPRSQVRFDTNNGYGSTNTKIRNFSSVTSTGTAATGTVDATNGASITINEGGVFQVHYCDDFSAASDFGISINSNQLTTSILSITQSARLARATSSAANFGACVDSPAILSPGDVVRAHAAGTTSGANTTDAVFLLTKVSN